MPSTRARDRRAPSPSTAAQPRRRPPASRRRTARPATPRASAIPVSSRTWPPNSAASCSMTVGPSAAATRSGSPRPQSIANGMPQTFPDGVVSGVLKSPCASNQAIAEPVARPCAPQAGHRAGVGRAVAAEDEQPASSGRRAAERRRDEVALARQERADPRAVLRPRIRVRRRIPGRFGSVAGVAQRRRRPDPAARPSRSTSPSAAQPGGRPLHPATVAAERGRRRRRCAIGAASCARHTVRAS